MFWLYEPQIQSNLHRYYWNTENQKHSDKMKAYNFVYRFGCKLSFEV